MRSILNKLVVSQNKEQENVYIFQNFMKILENIFLACIKTDLLVHIIRLFFLKPAFPKQISTHLGCRRRWVCGYILGVLRIYALLKVEGH
jgi:hypothetical protein